MTDNKELNIDKIKVSYPQDKFKASLNNCLNLAFVGDAVWTLFVRDFFANNTNYKNTFLHKLTTKFVKASYQAMALDKLQNILTNLEKDLARRARNTKMNTVSKNASIADYKKATGFEAIIGYLYLTENFDRIKIFFNILKEDFLGDKKWLLVGKTVFLRL